MYCLRSNNVFVEPSQGWSPCVCRDSSGEVMQIVGFEDWVGIFQVNKTMRMYQRIAPECKSRQGFLPKNTVLLQETQQHRWLRFGTSLLLFYKHSVDQKRSIDYAFSNFVVGTKSNIHNLNQNIILVSIFHQNHWTSKLGHNIEYNECREEIRRGKNKNKNINKKTTTLLPIVNWVYILVFS